MVLFLMVVSSSSLVGQKLKVFSKVPSKPMKILISPPTMMWQLGNCLLSARSDFFILSIWTRHFYFLELRCALSMMQLSAIRMAGPSDHFNSASCYYFNRSLAGFLTLNVFLLAMMSLSLASSVATWYLLVFSISLANFSEYSCRKKMSASILEKVWRKTSIFFSSLRKESSQKGRYLFMQTSAGFFISYQNLSSLKAWASRVWNRMKSYNRVVLRSSSLNSIYFDSGSLSNSSSHFFQNSSLVIKPSFLIPTQRAKAGLYLPTLIF